MKKVALVFVLAVLVPSLVLAWLAVRSLRDQQFLLERQQSLLDQRVTDTLAQNISDYLAQQQQAFSSQVESLAAAGDPKTLAAKFDDQLRQHWPLAEVGFCVTASGKMLSPPPNARPAAQMFRLDNSAFLGNREPVEVYSTANNFNGNASFGNAAANSSLNFARGQANQSTMALNNPPANSTDLMPPAPRGPPIAAEPPGRPNSAALARQDPPAASLGELAGGGQGFNGFGRNEAGSPSTAANNGNAIAYGGNAGVNGQLNSGRTQANQVAFAINGAYANAAASAPPMQHQQLRAATRSIAPGPFRPSQAFAISDGVGGAEGVGKDALLSDSAVPSATISKPVLTHSSLPTQRPEPPQLATAKALPATSSAANTAFQQTLALDKSIAQKDAPDQSAASGFHSPGQEHFPSQSPASSTLNYKAAQSRKVSPQSQIFQNVEKATVENAADDGQNNLSKVVPAEAEFRQLIGDQTDGLLARFLQNKLKLMCWHRLNAEPDLIFGAQLNLDRVVADLRGFVQPDRSWSDDMCLAVLDDNARPVVVSRASFQANWKRPFVATELGDALPHWEAVAYLVNPAQLRQAAHTATLTLGLLVVLLLIAIGTGSLLIVRSLGAELKLARQKTDFVGNVSHELKTPLTSIRMFSELLAEGRVADPVKQHSYLQIITAEAARLTRLINNVLDFSRMERGEKKYNFQACELTDLVRATAETYRPHLESAGFHFACELPAERIAVRADADALSQVIVNLLSNAEKYSACPERRSPTRPAGGLSSNDKPGPESGSESMANVAADARRQTASKESPVQVRLLTSSATPPDDRDADPEIGAPPKEIILHLAQIPSPLPHAEIRVLDRGPGVARGCEEKVFEKFYRAHDSLSSGIQGSGLGLTIARQIARAHGGEVVYEPRDGGGSCFVLRLPILASDEHR